MGERGSVLSLSSPGGGRGKVVCACVWSAVVFRVNEFNIRSGTSNIIFCMCTATAVAAAVYIYTTVFRANTPLVASRGT